MSDKIIKLFPNGVVTQKQVLTIVATVLIVSLILCFVKKVLKSILTVGVLVGSMVYFGLISPEQLQDVSKVVAEQGQGVFAQIADTSEYVRIDFSDGFIVEVLMEDQWINVSDITSFAKSINGMYEVALNDAYYSISDEGIKEMLDLLEE